MTEDRMGFRHWAEAEPDRAAVVDAAGRTRTYGELHADVNRLSDEDETRLKPVRISPAMAKVLAGETADPSSSTA